MRQLCVWWDGQIAGRLAQDDHGDLWFIYDAAWIAAGGRALSRSLPVRDAPFGRRACRPFFGGLLPEADQRSGVAGVLGVSAANEFALLDRLGGDVAGALSLLAEGDVPPAPPSSGPLSPALSSQRKAGIAKCWAIPKSS